VGRFVEELSQDPRLDAGIGLVAEQPSPQAPGQRHDLEEASPLFSLDADSPRSKGAESRQTFYHGTRSSRVPP
jgi:hypothetical protein